MAEALDVAIIGAGPAGLSASIYLARAGLRCTAFSSGPSGGALAEIAQIANYPGFTGSGPALADAMKKQAEAAGARVAYGECTAIRRLADEDDLYPGAGGQNSQGEQAGQEAREIREAQGTQAGSDGFILTIDGEEILARTVLAASGSHPKRLSFDLAKPVSYCALCDGDFARGKHVAVIGGANSAVQEALYLANLAKQVTIITHSKLKAESALQERAKNVANIKIIEQVEPTAEMLNEFDQIFVYIGKIPASGFLRRLGAGLFDNNGYVVTGRGYNEDSQGSAVKKPDSWSNNGWYLHETEVKGLFAAGDVRANMIQQVVTAAGDGAAAAIEIIDFMK